MNENELELASRLLKSRIHKAGVLRFKDEGGNIVRSDVLEIETKYGTTEQFEDIDAVYDYLLKNNSLFVVVYDSSTERYTALKQKRPSIFLKNPHFNFVEFFGLYSEAKAKSNDLNIKRTRDNERKVENPRRVTKGTPR